MQPRGRATATNQPGILRKAQDFFEQPAQAPGQQGPGLSFNCILVGTIIGTFCCCFCGLIGLILAIWGYSNDDEKKLQAADKLGVCGNICGIVTWLCFFGFSCVVIIAYV